VIRIVPASFDALEALQTMEETILKFNTPTIIFLVVGIGFSFFFGLKATEIFRVPTEGTTRAWKFYQFWFNFLGSLIGWVALWFLARKITACLLSSCPAQVDSMDILVIFISFVGITGHLPYTVMGLIQGLNDLAKKITGSSK
jgi:hypothetical protein